MSDDTKFWDEHRGRVADDPRDSWKNGILVFKSAIDLEVKMPEPIWEQIHAIFERLYEGPPKEETRQTRWRSCQNDWVTGEPGAYFRKCAWCETMIRFSHLDEARKIVFPLCSYCTWKYESCPQ
jgi:hypothetical protein